MNIRANATFRAGDFSRLEAVLVPKIKAAVAAGTDAVFQESQNLVPIDTGELKASGNQSVEWSGHQVVGSIEYTAEHAAFLEFGVGQRGAASPGAGPYNYGDLPGQPAQPYCRPALDSKRPEIKAAFEDQGFKA